ncbi:MAG: hypothetical protein K0R51_3539, partial [Cytophagaceae bacterium]|nr:hypothetical protein [Cytophagaceae bacterium]
MEELFSAYDILVLRWIHHNRIESLDNVLYYLSFATTFVSIGILISLLVIFIQSKDQKFKRLFFQMLAVFFVSATVSLTMKNTLFRTRPFDTYSDIHKLSEAGSSSFPSGHTMEAFAMAMGLTLLLKNRKYTILVFTWAFLVAYSRMALG